MTTDRDIIAGAVAAGPPIVTIWSGFKRWLGEQGLPFDFLLYSTYKRQVEDLVAGRIHAAWNTPTAWIRARRLAEKRGVRLKNSFMRDTDFDVRSAIVAGAGSGIERLSDLKGKTLAVGSPDSLESTTMPLALCLDAGLTPGEDFEVQFCSDVLGLDGGHQPGEVEAARSAREGRAHAAGLAEGNYQAFLQDGTLSSDVKAVAYTEPYDHCNMTVNLDVLSEASEERMRELFLAMPYEKPELTPCMDLEAVKEWKYPRDSHLGGVERAMDRVGELDIIRRHGA